MNKTIQQRKILSDKSKHLVKAVDQPTIKLVQRLKDKKGRLHVITIN